MCDCDKDGRVYLKMEGTCYNEMNGFLGCSSIRFLCASWLQDIQFWPLVLCLHCMGKNQLHQQERGPK